MAMLKRGCADVSEIRKEAWSAESVQEAYLEAAQKELPTEKVEEQEGE